MSECVVRMEMPKRCLDCPLHEFGGMCLLSSDFKQTDVFVMEKGRPDNCPIICPLPEGHGRLGDLDKLADDIKARKAFFGRMSDPQFLVEDATTTVPAEAERREE